MSAVKKGEDLLGQKAEDSLEKRIADARYDAVFYGGLSVAILALCVVVSIVISALVATTGILNPPALAGVVVLTIVFIALLATKSLSARYVYIKLISKK